MTVSDEPRPTFLARVARKPLPVLLGLAVGFLGCCAAGRVAARQQPLKNFVRFHPGLAPDSHYYPTFSQTMNLARQHVKPGKTLVIISGNSVLHGVGQRPAHVWTKHLQEDLGDGYVVLNLSMRGQWPNECGFLIAERLAADGVPVLVLTVGVETVPWGIHWDGGVYRHFFWDAWGKGGLPDEPRRAAWLDNFSEQYKSSEVALEHRRRGRIDGVTYSLDLWNYIADRYRGTVWTPLKYPKFWQPHRGMTDPDPGATIPFELVNNDRTTPPELAGMRALTNTPTAQALLRGEHYEGVARQYGDITPDVLRDRALFVLRVGGTYYRAQLTPKERADYEALFARLAEELRYSGFHAQAVGKDYGERDYFDRSHFSEQGGKKLAADLAPTIRAMNDKLYGPRPRSTDAP